MRMSKAQLELAKKRGAKVIDQPSAPVVETTSGEPVSEQKQDVSVKDSMDAVVLSSVATMKTLEEIKVIAEKIASGLHRDVSPPQPSLPPSYRFTVFRDRNNRMTEIVAKPMTTKAK